MNYCHENKSKIEYNVASFIAVSLISQVQSEFIPAALGMNIIIGAVILLIGTLLNPETKDRDLS